MRFVPPTSILLAAALLVAAIAAFGLQAPPAKSATAQPGGPPSPQDVLAEVEKLLEEAERAAPQRPSRPVEILRRGAPEPLSAERIEQIIAVARDVDPELAQQLQEFRAKNPGPRFERALRQARHLVGLRDLKERDPMLYEMKIAQLRLEPQVEAAVTDLRQARAADGGAGRVADLELRLRKLLRQQIGLSMAVRVQYIRLMEQQLQAMKDELARDGDGLDAAVDRKMQTLLGE